MEENRTLPKIISKETLGKSYINGKLSYKALGKYKHKHVIPISVDVVNFQ